MFLFYSWYPRRKVPHPQQARFYRALRAPPILFQLWCQYNDIRKHERAHAFVQKDIS